MKIIVNGHLPRKSNSRRIFRSAKTGRPIIAKSTEALQYEKDFARQINGNMKIGIGSADNPLRLTAYIYYRSNRSDLSDELLCDLLQKSGVISDDRYIKEKHLYGGKDQNNPRVELEIEEI